MRQKFGERALHFGSDLDRKRCSLNRHIHPATNRSRHTKCSCYREMCGFATTKYNSYPKKLSKPLFSRSQRTAPYICFRNFRSRTLFVHTSLCECTHVLDTSYMSFSQSATSISRASSSFARHLSARNTPMHPSNSYLRMVEDGTSLRTQLKSPLVETRGHLLLDVGG